MSFVRPEAQAVLRRWREALAGFALIAIGGLVYLGALGWVFAAFGAVLALAGAVLAFIGVQRGRFRSGEDGPGVVNVTEGRLAYFGPLSGGVADLDDVTQILIDRSATPDHWCIEHRSGPSLYIPLTAAGADGLFDAFAGLPGFDTEAMLREMHRKGTGRALIWARARPAEAPRHLH
ncbi:hypothetical protein [Roseivivax sp. CAU 1753]